MRADGTRPGSYFIGRPVTACVHVVFVGGGGTVGTTAAYSLALERPDVEISICDVDGDAAWGHATDLRHARCHAGHPLGTASVAGSVSAVEPGPVAVEGADCVVVTASVPRPPAGGERGGRDTYWPANGELADEIAGWLAETDPCPVLVVTNPVDRVLARLHEGTGWPRQWFVGYSLSETARVADAIASRLDVDPATVDCPVLGEHGEHIVPAFSRATVGGSPLELPADARQAVTEYARSIPYDVIQKRGGTDSSRWVTGRGTALVAEALLAEEPSGPVCLSTPLAGEYGVEDVALGVPLVLSAGGVERIVEWDLAPAEREALETAASAVADAT